MNPKKKIQSDEVILGIVGVTFFLVEYGVYINYLREPFIYPGLFYTEPLHGYLVSIALAVHALLCLVNAFITGKIIHQRKIVSTPGCWFFAIVCAEIDLLISPFCVGLSLFIVIPIGALFFSLNASAVIFEVIGVIVTVSAYIGGHILSSVICIRAAEGINKPL